MKILFKYIEQIKQRFQKYFIANDSEPSIVRKKHLRLGALVSLVFLLLCYFIQSGDSLSQKLKTIEASKVKLKEDKNALKTTPAIDTLADGLRNELLWTEVSGKEIENINKN